jgi:GTP-binding protein Era
MSTDDTNLLRRCGYVALLGRPNAGKSTLLNALVGQKLAGVSNKPQTTRNRILGICQVQDAQVLLLDTPGIHRNAKKMRLNNLMNREAWSVLEDADLVLYLVDCVRGWDERDADFLASLIKGVSSKQAKIQVLVSKSDQKKKTEVQQVLCHVQEQMKAIIAKIGEGEQSLVAEPKAVSAKHKDSVSLLMADIAQQMPEGDWLYPEEDLTDRPQKFIVGELIREKVFRLLGDELPYQAAVVVQEIVFEKGLVKVSADIIVARQTHKGMVIGKKAAKIKEIGSQARQGLEHHFETQVFLDLQVRVDESWIDDESLIAEYAGIDASANSKK